MTKPRIIIPFTIQFATRYIVQTKLLEKMSVYSQPVVLCRWNDPTLRREVESLGGEYYQLPSIHLQTGYTRIKRQLDLWHLRQIQSPTPPIDARRKAKLNETKIRQRLRDNFYKFYLAVPGRPDQLRKQMQKAIWECTNIEVFDRILENLKADAVFSLTPYIQHEQLLLHAASQRNIALITSILSFDNLTTRGLIPVTFDAYFLWNEYNRKELQRIYPASNDKLSVIVGAPQFDFYWDPSCLWEETTWRKRLGIPADRPVILFGAGHYSVVPNEQFWLQQLDDAISNKEIPEKPIILFRRHPNDPLKRWKSVLNRANHIIYDEPWFVGKKDQALTSIRRTDIEKLTSTLAFCQVHINASSTMTVDGAIFDRPQIGPAYDDRPGKKYDRVVKELYLREHYLPITNSGGLKIVYNREQLIKAVIDEFRYPSQRSVGRKKIVQEICTFDDGQATNRVNQALRLFWDNRC